jgi:uncharacterized membrane protein YoaK (UPF0700 family)
MSETDRTRRRPSSPEVGKAERALVQLAALLAALAGLVDAIGFLAFGHVFLASPDANATVLGASLSSRYDVALFAGAMVLSFVAGVMLITLVTHRAEQFRRTVVISGTALALIAAYFAFNANVAFAPAVLLAMAMGEAHCIFARDNADLDEAMSPSAQIARFGEALAQGRNGTNHRQIGLHASFWLAFLIGGLAGAGAWIAFDAGSFALAAGLAGVLTLRTWLIERDFLPA